MDIKSVVEKNQSWSTVDVEMKPVNDNDKNILNQNSSLYMMTKKSIDSIVPTGLSSINENDPMSSVHSLVRSTDLKNHTSQQK